MAPQSPQQEGLTSTEVTFLLRPPPGTHPPWVSPSPLPPKQSNCIKPSSQALVSGECKLKSLERMDCWGGDPGLRSFLPVTTPWPALNGGDHSLHLIHKLLPQRLSADGTDALGRLLAQHLTHSNHSVNDHFQQQSNNVHICEAFQ